MYNQYKFTQAAIERSVEIVIYVLFQFTRPTRAVTLDRTEAGIDRVILIRTAYTAAIFIVQQTIRCLPFQIRTTPRVVIQRFHFCTVYLYFNSRDRTDRDSFLACIWAAISHFNSHDPTGRDGNMQQISGLFVISIHATYTGRDPQR